MGACRVATASTGREHNGRGAGKRGGEFINTSGFDVEHHGVSTGVSYIVILFGVADNRIDRVIRILQFARGEQSHLTMPAHNHYTVGRSEEHTSELQSRGHLVCRL